MKLSSHSMYVLLLITISCSSCASRGGIGLAPLQPIPGDSIEPLKAPVVSNESFGNEPPRLELFGKEPVVFQLGDDSVVVQGADAPEQADCANCRSFRSPAPCLVTCQPADGGRWGSPQDEYVCDGGDSGSTVRVRSDWSVDGMEAEDTIAHFDTLSGSTEAVPSTRACVYSPRFASVRKVTHTLQQSTNHVAVQVRELSGPLSEKVLDEPVAVKQPEMTVRTVGTDIGISLQENQLGLTVDDVDRLETRTDGMIPFEHIESQPPYVATDQHLVGTIEGQLPGTEWRTVEMGQVILDGSLAYEQKGIRNGQSVDVYDMPPGQPRLRLVKLASRCDGQPGDIVEFTIRFDNVGDQAIGNVTIIDKLTYRLEYIKGSGLSSVDAKFVGDEVSGETLSLRWEITEPLEQGEGGIIRFKCRLR